MALTINYSRITLESEFTANTFTANTERVPDVTALSNGGFVTAYVSNGFTLLDFYDSNFNVVGAFEIPYTGATNNIGGVAVTQLNNGNVLVTWDDEAAGEAGMRAHIYTSSGVSVSGEFFLSGVSTGFEDPSIAATADGGFAVSITFNDNVFVHKYDSNGNDIGGFVQVNTVATVGAQKDSSIAALADGGYVVTYSDLDPADQLIRATVYNANGTVRTADFVVASFGDNTQSSVVGLQNGGFAVVYTDSGWVEGGTLGNGISLQLLNSAGGLGSLIQVNTSGTPDEVDPDVTILENGFILVTWTRPFSAADDDIYARVFTQTGASVTINGSSTQFVITASGADDIQSSVAGLLGGGYTVAWQDSTGADISQVVEELTRTTVGDAANDAFTGDELRDSIDGGGGNDTLSGAENDDTILGNDGDDFLSGGSGDDLLQGGLNGDTINGDSGNDTIFANTQAAPDGSGVGDVLNGGFGADTITGSLGGDTIDGGSEDDLINGGNGNDLLQGGLNADTISGGLGDDTIFAMTQADADGSGVSDSLDGGDGDDSIRGSGGNDTLLGGANNDTLDGGAFNDTLNGGTGNDTYIVDDAADQVIEAAGGGSDTVRSSVSYGLQNGQEIEVLTTTNAAGVLAINLAGNEFAQAIQGNAGNNGLTGRGGADTMTGFAGNDVYVIDNAGDRAIEAVGGGTDTVQSSVSYGLFAGQEIETLTTTNDAGVTAINLSGNEFNNTIRGNAGNNGLTGRGGADTMIGFGGNDIYVVDNAGDRPIEAVGGGTDTVQSSVSYGLQNGQEIEVLTTDNNAGVTAINLSGNEFAQTIRGNAGNNGLTGRGGADTMIGFGGNDVYVIDNAGDRPIEAVGGGTDTVQSSVSYGLQNGEEIEVLTTDNNAGVTAINLSGNEFAQTIRGNAGNNGITGRGGADTMIGFGGNDIYVVDNAGDQVTEAVGGGTDTVQASVTYALQVGQEIETLNTDNVAGVAAINLTGNEFSQTIRGNAGNNVINGRAGADTLTGFGGNDTFAFNTSLGASNIDRITDFVAANDTIQLDQDVFTALALGALAATAFKNLTLGAQDANDRILYNDVTGAIFYDGDGLGGTGPIQFATLDTNPTITNADFFVVA